MHKKAFIMICAAALVLSGAAPGIIRAEEHGDALMRYALIVGSNNGGQGRMPLRYAVADANAFMEVMEKIGGIPEENIIPLFNPDRRNFNSSMNAIYKKITGARPQYKKIELIFYYSGHSDEEGILLGNEKVSYREIRKAIEQMQADVKIAVLDSCSSGAFTQVKGGTIRSPFLLDASYDMKGYAFMSSSSADEVSQESDRIKGSFFTHFLLTGLRGAADLRQDGRITLNEAYQFAYTETLARTEKTVSGPQHPHYNIQMTGTGDVIMTDIRRTSSAIVIDRGVEGRIFIHDGTSRLVGEFIKPYGRNMRLALEKGSYKILNVKAGALFEADIDITAGQKTITERDFIPASRELTTARGGSAANYSGEGYLIPKMKLRYSGYGAPALQFSYFDGGMNVLIGGRGGLIVNDRFVIGGAGYGLVTPYRNEINGQKERLEIGYGGLLFECYFFPGKPFNLSLEACTGGGGIAHYSEGHNGSDTLLKKFFFVEPGVTLYANLTPFCRIGAGISCRYVSGMGGSGMSNSDLMGFSATIVIAFGGF